MAPRRAVLAAILAAIAASSAAGAAEEQRAAAAAVVSLSQASDQDCDECQKVTGALVQIGTFAACYAKCDELEPGRGRIVWCNILCNMIAGGACSRQGLNCKRGLCRATRRCSGPALLANLSQAVLPHEAEGVRQPAGALEATVLAQTVAETQGFERPPGVVALQGQDLASAQPLWENASAYVVPPDAGEEDTERCDSCQSLTRGLLSVGTFAGCYSKCSTKEPGGGRIVWCNVLCNLVIRVGCSKHGLNCERGLCRAAGRCVGPAPRWALIRQPNATEQPSEQPSEQPAEQPCAAALPAPPPAGPPDL